MLLIAGVVVLALTGVTSITITGPGEATAVVDEAGDALRMSFVREPDGWKISEIVGAP